MLDFINANIDDKKVMLKIEQIFSVWSASCPPLLTVIKKNGENQFLRTTINGLTKSMAIEIIVSCGLDVDRPFGTMSSILKPYEDEILSLKAQLASLKIESQKTETLLLDLNEAEARLTDLLDSYGPSCGVNHLIQRVVSKLFGVHLIDNYLWEQMFQGRSDENR
jgi:hypothetical protein